MVFCTCIVKAYIMLHMKFLDIFQDSPASVSSHLSILVEFILAMQEKLRNINENSYNNFMLKIGESSCQP